MSNVVPFAEQVAQVRAALAGADAEREAIQAEPPKPDPFGVIFAPKLAEPLPPIEWICEGIGLPRGALGLFAGSSFAGKSLVLAEICLSIAAGVPAFGVYQTTRGRVLMLDFDGQGLRTTAERLQRLARHRGIDLPALDRLLGYSWMPSIKLDSDGSFAMFKALLDGVSVCVIDSWRGAATGTDEASRAEVQRVGEILLRLVEATGCTIVMVDHLVKPPVDGKNGRAKVHDVHGSTAKAELPPLIWRLDAGKEPLTAVLMNAKNRIRGRQCDPVRLRFTDVVRGDDPRWGLAVQTVDDEQIAAEERAEADRLRARAETRVLEFLRQHAGVFRGPKLQFARSVGGNNDSNYAAILALESRGALVREGSYRDLQWRLKQ